MILDLESWKARTFSKIRNIAAITVWSTSPMNPTRWRQGRLPWNNPRVSPFFMAVQSKIPIEINLQSSLVPYTIICWRKSKMVCRSKVAQRINSSNSTTVVRGLPQLPSSSALYLANKCSRSQDRHKEDEEHYRCRNKAWRNLKNSCLNFPMTQASCLSWVAAQQGEYLWENQSFGKVLHWPPSQIRWDFNCQGVVSSLKIVRKCL